MSIDNLSTGAQFTAIGTIGTTTLTNRSGVLQRVIIPGTYVGTVNFHDAVSATGTTATSQIISLGLPATSVPTSLQIGATFRYGLVAQATGTPVLTVMWS